MKKYNQFINESIKKDPRSLISAIQNYDINKIKELISAGVNINYRDKKFRNCPLMYAIDQNYIEAVRLLIDAGADIFLLNTVLYKDDPFSYSIKKGNVEVVKIILEKVDDVNRKYSFNDNVLQKALSNREKIKEKYYDLETIDILVDKGLDLNNINERKTTCLLEACINDYYEIANKLLDYDIDVNVRDAFGISAIMYTNNIYTFEKLLLKNAVVDFKSDAKEKSFLDINQYIRDFIEKDYDVQKFILKNRPDTFSFFNSYIIWKDKIKEEFKDLFSAEKWGLIV